MNRKTREFVIARAGSRCEYCGLLQAQLPFFSFQIEHIRARQHRGSDSPDNLCLACIACNSFKGTNQSAYDPVSGELVPLFNPRNDDWNANFRAAQGRVMGLTAVGRATVELLQMNRDQMVEVRHCPLDTEN